MREFREDNIATEMICRQSRHRILLRVCRFRLIQKEIELLSNNYCKSVIQTFSKLINFITISSSPHQLIQHCPHLLMGRHGG